MTITHAPEAPASHPLLVDAKRAMLLARAVVARDEQLAFEISRDLATSPVEPPACEDERELQLQIQNGIDQALRLVVLGPEASTTTWKRLLLPDSLGLFEGGELIAMARRLRLAGSPLPERQLEPLDPTELVTLNLRGQALALGRFCLVRDAGGPEAVDLAALRSALDPRLVPFFHEWLLTAYCTSPIRLTSDLVLERQQEALAEYAQHKSSSRAAEPCGSGQAMVTYEAAYAADRDLARLASITNGVQARGLFERFKPLPGEQPHERPDTAVLEAYEAAVICPNWRDAHVIHRCLGPLTEGLDPATTVAARIVPASDAHKHPAPDGWQGRCLDLPHDEHYVLSDMAAICDGIAKADLDFAFLPEIVASNSSAWMATQRLARVQATGYGYPVTSGLPTLDYYLGGADVEAAGDDYSEDLVLIPGLGVSTTAPPRATVARQRPLDDEQVQLVAITSKHKLSRSLARAWDAILDGPGKSELRFFTNMSASAAAHYAEPLGELLVSGPAVLETSAPRRAVIDGLVEADVYLDAFPFGGFNTLVEVLTTGCPVVTLEGQHARNRFGAAILRRLGLPEFLIAKDHDEYVATARRLIADAGLRQELRAAIGTREDVLSKLTDEHAPAHFAAAVDYMRRRGPKRPGQRSAPVLIRAGEQPRTWTH